MVMKNDRGDESTAITGLRPTRGNGWVPRDLFTRRDDSSGESELGETLFSTSCRIVRSTNWLDHVNIIICAKRCSSIAFRNKSKKS